LLTMSSGFDANDDDENSPGNEEKMYPTSDWVKFTLDLPMDEKRNVGEKWAYFTAGVILLGDILNKSVPEGLEKYADKKLFQPLGITKYEWQYTPQKLPNTAGGLRMSALDFARYASYIGTGANGTASRCFPQPGWKRRLRNRYRCRKEAMIITVICFGIRRSILPAKSMKRSLPRGMAAARSSSSKISRWSSSLPPPLTTNGTCTRKYSA